MGWFKKDAPFINPFDNEYYQMRSNRAAQFLRPNGPPSSLFKYSVVSELSASPRVCLAIEPASRKLYVLKVVADANTRIEVRQQKLEEARAALRFENGSTLPLYAVEAEPFGNVVALVSRYCVGGSFRDRMRHSVVSRTEVIYHLLATLAAIVGIHETGGVHGDVKPDNIFFDYSDDELGNELRWRTLLGDFGASDLAGTARRSYSNLYTSPEALRGAVLTPSDDIWSWGVVAWEALTGSHPYEHISRSQGEAGRKLISNLIQDAVETSVSSWRDEGWIEELARLCVAKEADARPTARDILSIFAGHTVFVSKSIKQGAFDNRDATRFPFGLSVAETLKWRTEGKSVFSMTTNGGWVGRWANAEKLANLGTATGSNEALHEVGRLFRGNGDQRSPAHQLMGHPTIRAIEMAVPRESDPSTIPLTTTATRSELFGCLATGIRAFVDLCEQHHGWNQQTENIARELAALASKVSNELNPEQRVLAAQLFMFLGEYMTASTFLRSGNDLSESIKLIAEVTVHDLVFAQGDIPGNLELAAAMAAKLSYALERNHNRQLATAWHLNECVDWLHAGQNYERVAEVLSVLPPQMDFVGLIRLVLLRRLETRDPSTWEALQLLAYRAKSFRKMWLALECIWEYAGQGEAIDCATSALSDPHWSLPFCRGFRRDLEDLIAGNPRFRH